MATVTPTQATAGVVSPLTGKAPVTDWRKSLRPASWRGIPFFTLGGQIKVGRRNAVHEYPNRDTVWVEDLGRSARRMTVIGFLVGDDVVQQRERMIAACEAPGDGQLVHMTLGALTVSLMDTTFDERWDKGRYCEVSFVFVESGQRSFPSNVTSTSDATRQAATAADSAASADFATRVTSSLAGGAAVAGQASTAASGWASNAKGLANDATSLTNMVSTLPGSYSRFFGGASKGLAGITSGIPGAITTIEQLIATGSVNRTSVYSAASGLSGAASQIAAVGGILNFAMAAQSLAAALLSSSSDPADSIRLLTTLAVYSANFSTPSGAVGGSMVTMQSGCGDLFRRAAVTGLARASAQYQPSSFDDAVSIRTQVCSSIDAEIQIAGNQGEDASFSALRALRSCVVADLTDRGAKLATLMTVNTNLPIPAPVLAQRIYRDSTRSNELVAEANPIHPAFMPTQFKALSQ